MTVRLLVTSSSANLLLSAYQPTRILITTYINPDRALRDQIRFCTVLQLRSDQPQHILTTTKKLKARGIVDISLSFVETFLSIRLDNIQTSSVPSISPKHPAGSQIRRQCAASRSTHR